MTSSPAYIVADGRAYTVTAAGLVSVAFNARPDFSAAEQTVGTGLLDAPAVAASAAAAVDALRGYVDIPQAETAPPASTAEQDATEEDAAERFSEEMEPEQDDVAF